MQQPQVDITLSNARIYDVKSIEIAKGEKFTLDAIVPSGHPIDTIYEVFSNNDGVLNLDVRKNTIKAEAVSEGGSAILLMDSNRQIMKTIVVTVMSSITELASTLEFTPEPPVFK